MKKLLKVSALTITMLLLTSTLTLLNPAVASPTPELKILNPGPDGYPLKWTAGTPPPTQIGTKYFNFTSDTTEYGDTFFVNITIQNVANMKAWGIGLIYDKTVLEFVSAWRPSDHVFKPVEDMGWTIVAPAVGIDEVDPTHNIIKWGCAYIMGEPPWSFTGSGTLCQIQFRIKKGVNRLDPLVTSELYFDPDWTGVYYYPTGSEVPILEKGYFKYEWAVPTKIPQFYVKPTIYKNDLDRLGSEFVAEVWVKDVDAGWNIIGFQFSLWFNTSCMEPVGYETGTWMNSFANNGEMVLQAAYADYHGVDPELPICYNKWTAIIFLVKGNEDKYWEPFPSGEGMLFRFRFKWVCETLFPLEYWTVLELHDEQVRDQFGMIVNTQPSINGYYRCPVKKLGLSIDVYTEYPAPYGGQGPNNPSDMFAPQQEVTLYALVTYNEDPVQQKLVAFEIHHGNLPPIFRQAITNQDGIATVSFRIPWPCQDPVNTILGEWKVIATVEVAERVVNDTLTFKVWWPVEITKVESLYPEYIKVKNNMPVMKFTVEYRTYAMQPIPLLLTVTVYDELGFFIGSTTYEATVGWGEYGHYCEFKTYSIVLEIPMPSHAAVGTATVYANAFNKYPWTGGVPYCPEISNTFLIKKP